MSNTLTMTRVWTCPDCHITHLVGAVVESDSCCGRAVVRPKTFDDRVQVSIFGNKRAYTFLKVGIDLRAGDLVQVPLRNTNVIGTVIALESEYAGMCAPVLQRITKREPAEESIK